MPYLVIHQNPIGNKYIRNEYCGDIVVFHINGHIEYDEYQMDELKEPEYDTKLVIKNKEWMDYIQSIPFEYDEIDDTNCMRETRWCESERIRFFNSFIEMYDHIIVCRVYTVFHHMNEDRMIQYFYKDRMKHSPPSPPFSASLVYSSTHLVWEG